MKTKPVSQMTDTELEEEITRLEKLSADSRKTSLELGHFVRIEQLRKEQLRRSIAKSLERNMIRSNIDDLAEKIKANQRRGVELSNERKSLNLEIAKDRKRQNEIFAAQERLYAEFDKLKARWEKLKLELEK